MNYCYFYSTTKGAVLTICHTNIKNLYSIRLVLFLIVDGRSVPLNVKIGIEEAALPQSCDLFCFLLCGISRHCGEHHHSPALLGQLQQFFRFRGVHFGEVNGRRSPLVLRKVPFFNVVILLWDRYKSNDLQCLR